MSGPPAARAASPWEEAGREAAAAADDASAVVVIGVSPEAAAEAALGIGQVQARRRRVAIVDLVGDVAPLRALVPDEDAHGVVDSFVYGVSLNKIARQVDDGGNLFVMPTGTEPIDHGEILRSDRWRRLMSGFREVGALLLLVAPADADGLDALLASSDGAIVVGPVGNRLPTGTPLLGTVPARRTTRPLDPAAAAAAAAPVAAAEPAPSRRRPWVLPAAAGLVALATVAAGVYYAGRARDAAVTAAAAPAADTAAPVAAAPRDTAPPLPVANPADSAAAVPWVVEIVKANTEAGAALKVRDDLGDMPAATWTPLVLTGDSVRWYRVTVGTFADRAGADSLLRDLRARGLVAAEGGNVLRAPFSLLLEPSVARDSAAAASARWSGRGIPALAVAADTGRAQVVAGAFETPEQAALLATSLQAAGIAPTVVYRTGRVF